MFLLDIIGHAKCHGTRHMQESHLCQHILTTLKVSLQLNLCAMAVHVGKVGKACVRIDKQIQFSYINDNPSEKKRIKAWHCPSPMLPISLIINGPYARSPPKMGDPTRQAGFLLETWRLQNFNRSAAQVDHLKAGSVGMNKG